MIESQYHGTRAGGSLRGAAAKSCCESLCGDLLQKSLLRAQLQQFFAQKYFESWSGTPFVIVFPTENFGSMRAGFDLLLLWQKNGFEDPATHGPYMVLHHMPPTPSCPTANHQIMMWMLVITINRYKATQHPKPTRNVMWKAWGGKSSALWREAQICWNTHSLLLFSSPALKTPPAGCILESDNGYICKIYYCRNSLFVSNATIIESPLASHLIICFYHHPGVSDIIARILYLVFSHYLANIVYRWY